MGWCLLKMNQVAVIIAHSTMVTPVIKEMRLSRETSMRRVW